MGSAHSIRSTHFQRPSKDTSVENISDEEFDDHRTISITNKMVERLVEDATLAGGAATAAPTPKPKGEYRDKIYSEKLKCMDDSHSERCRMGYPKELCELLSEVNNLHDQIGDICIKQADIFSFVSHCHQKIDECNESLAILNDKLKTVETSVSHHHFSLMKLIETADPTVNRAEKQSDGGDHLNVYQIQSMKEVIPPVLDVFSTQGPELRKVMSEPCKDTPTFNTSQNNEDIITHQSTSDEQINDNFEEIDNCKDVYHDTENICNTCGFSKTTKTGDEKKYIHLCNITSDFNDVKTHLVHLCADKKCSVQLINTKGNNKSYKLGVPIAFYDKVLSPKIWPEHALVRPWVSFRRNRQPQ